MGTKDVYYHAKKRAIDIKTPLVIFNMQKKVLFIKNVSDLTSFSQDYGLFFFRTLISVILFPETFFILGKKAPRI